jgi:hypothetical protein
MIGINSVLILTFIGQKCLGQLTTPLVIVTDLTQFHGTVFGLFGSFTVFTFFFGFFFRISPREDPG